MPVANERHYALVGELLADGQAVVFLGAGANLCDRPDGTAWEPGRFPPSGAELARTLAEHSRYPDTDEPDLLRISQYVDAILGERQLYRYLHSVFDADYPPSSLHRLLARLPAVLRERGRGQLLILTTNYDDLVEQALAAAGEPFDVVWYEATRGPLRGRFLHRRPDGKVVAIERPNKYTGLALAERPVILKLHGAIDRSDPKGDISPDGRTLASGASTGAYGCGTSGRAVRCGGPWRAAESTASRSATTAGRWRPGTSSSRCGSGRASSGTTGRTSATRCAASSPAT